MQHKIAELLVSEDQRLFNADPEPVKFTENPNANKLLNDLADHPHAYVLGCIMDRQIKAEKAWIIPYLFSEKLGNFNFQTLTELSEAKILRLMTKPENLHRFSKKMSKNFYLAVKMIAERYNGNAAEIWSGTPSSAKVVHHFRQFRGVGPKIATMAANILARNFKVPFSDYDSIDISADVHVRRVFSRLGLTRPDDNNDAAIYCARFLHPEFPGLLDFPAWEIGKKWCHPNKPQCSQCMMQTVCPTAQEQTEQ